MPKNSVVCQKSNLKNNRKLSGIPFIWEYFSIHYFFFSKNSRQIYVKMIFFGQIYTKGLTYVGFYFVMIHIATICNIILQYSQYHLTVFAQDFSPFFFYLNAKNGPNLIYGKDERCRTFFGWRGFMIEWKRSKFFW